MFRPPSRNLDQPWMALFAEIRSPNCHQLAKVGIRVRRTVPRAAAPDCAASANGYGAHPPSSEEAHRRSGTPADRARNVTDLRHFCYKDPDARPRF
jgi:hypothetical protein